MSILMKIQVTTDRGTQDITGLLQTAKWTGNYQNAAREFSCTLVSSAVDGSVPEAMCGLGAAMQVFEGAQLLFDGFVFSRTKNTDRSAMELTCFDRGLYLKRNRVSKKYVGKKPEDILAELAGEFGMSIGEIAATGVEITRNFFGVTIYDVMMTAYTLASRQTGQLYHIGFRGAKLCAAVRAQPSQALLICGGSNLICADTTETIANMVNAVGIYDENDQLIQTVENAEFIRSYGRMQEYLKQTKNDNMLSAAEKKLEENGLQQKITVDCLGDTRNIAGGSVIMQESYTGLYGLFFIENDVHEWKRGQYYNKLTLNFRQMMDEKEMGKD